MDHHRDPIALADHVVDSLMEVAPLGEEVP